MDKIVLYQKAKTGKTKVWSGWIVLKGESGYTEINYEWGLTDGKKQLTTDTISSGVNEGKSNETSPLEQAILTLERKIRKKKEEGYSENISNIEIEDVIDFTKPLPKSLCFYKPKNSIDDKKLHKLEKAGKAIYSVKRDGMMHIVRKTKAFGVEIYSRRMDLVTDKYPHLIKEFSKLDDDTILLGEMLLIDKDGRDNFNGVSQICRSDPEKAIERQKELGKVTYYIFDIAFLMGKNLLVTETFESRLTMLTAEIWNREINLDYIMRLGVLNLTHSEAMKWIKDTGLEGLVVWDAEGIMEQKYAFTFNGKASRPNVLWKSKPKYEDDFIVDFNPANDIGTYGKGKNNGKIKSAFIYQLDENGDKIFLGKCGGGLTDEQRDFYTSASWPRVWKIEYDSIQLKTGSPRFPVFNADRTLVGDKLIEECIMSETIKLAREEFEDE